MKRLAGEWQGMYGMNANGGGPRDSSNERSQLQQVGELDDVSLLHLRKAGCGSRPLGWPVDQQMLADYFSRDFNCQVLLLSKANPPLFQ